MYLPSSPTYPYGGNSASKPTTSVNAPDEAAALDEAAVLDEAAALEALAELVEALLAADELAALELPPEEHPASANAASASAIAATTKIFAFFIGFLPPCTITTL